MEQPASVAAITRRGACVALQPLVVPAGVRAIEQKIAAVRGCLAARGVRALGGPVFPAPTPLDPNEPGGELVIAPERRGSSGGMAFIAFYANAATASRLAGGIRANARRLHGEVSTRGAVTTLLIPPVGATRRAAVTACALQA